MTAISNRMPAIAVEYDGPRGERRYKEFKPEDLGKARRLYKTKLESGKNPALKRVP